MDRYYGNEWGRKGATIRDKTARLEYGLTQDEIYDAIDAGKLQYRPAAMHGNPRLRLLRREVEDLARTLHGDRDVREKRARAELARVNRELKQLRSQLAALEERRAALLSEYPVALCDLGVFANQAAEPIPPQDPDIRAHGGQTLTPNWRALAERPVRAMNAIVLDVLTQDQPQVPLAGDVSSA